MLLWLIGSDVELTPFFVCTIICAYANDRQRVSNEYPHLFVGVGG